MRWAARSRSPRGCVAAVRGCWPPSPTRSRCLRRWAGCPAPRGWSRRAACRRRPTSSSASTPPPRDGSAPAPVVLVAGLLDEIGVPIDQALATCLYAGLAADTGSFRFGSTQPETHELAARLLATGIDHSTISQRLFDTAPFGWLGLLSAVTGRAVLEPEVGAGLVWIWASTAEAAEHGLPGEQLEALVDVVRATAEADVACVLKGQDDGSWSVSLRSRGGTDLARVALTLGGGGHRLAAGYSSYLDREKTIEALRRELSEV